MTRSTPRSGWDLRRSLLLSKYERVALELFASRGFKSVTIDDIAEVAGVSARTLFRYFPSKNDFLLAFPRRNSAAMAEQIAALEPSDAPLATAWQLIRSIYTESPPDVSILDLWRHAAAEAPEVAAQANGERLRTLLDALTEYCARSQGKDAAIDPWPRILAGRLVGIEMAMIESLGRSSQSLPEVLAAADLALPVESITFSDQPILIQ